MTNKDSRRQFHFNVWHNKELEEFLDSKPPTKRSEFIRKILDDVRTGKLSYSKDEIDADTQYKLARAKIAQAKSQFVSEKEKELLYGLKLENEIKERQLSYHNTFDSSPSKQGESAIRKGINNQKTPRHHSINEELVKKYNYQYFENQELAHKTICKICEVLFESKEKHEAVDDVVWHLEEFHKTRAETVVRRN